MTLKIDTFGSIIDAFASLSQIASTLNFTHTFSFSSGKAIKDGDSIIPEIVYSGARVSKIGTVGEISNGNSYDAYTNYETIKIKSKPLGMSGVTSDDVKLIYKLQGINNQPGNNSTTSYDIFEKIDPNYSPENLEFKISLTPNYELAIVFAKAPPISKLEYPELFNAGIHRDSSFWGYSASNLSEVCASDRYSYGDRIVYLKVYKYGVEQPGFDSGDFKKFTLTSLGRDGRYALKSKIHDYLVASSINIPADSNGYVFNELIYPSKSDNSVLNIDSLGINNNLTIQLSLVFSTSGSQVSATIQVFDDYGLINLASGQITFPICPLSNIYSTLSVSSKNKEAEVIVKEVDTYLGTISLTTDPVFGNRYSAPQIYTFISPSTYIDSSSGEISLQFSEDLLIKAVPVYSGILPGQIYTSLDNAPFTNTDQATLTGSLKYGTHVFRSYVAASSGVNQSLVAEKIITVIPTIPTPVFSSSTAGGVLTITGTSNFNILYSTDGLPPDLVNRSNVALYTRPFKVKKKIVIKAVATLDGYYSNVVEYVFDPDVIFTTPATLPTIGLSGTQSGGVYSDVATVTLSSFTGVAYYTLDGSDPLDPENIARRVYVSPFKVLPVSNKTIELYVGVIRDGYASAKSYPSTPTLINFSFICNPWKLSDSTLDPNGAVVTSNGNLQLNSGGVVERAKVISGDFYYKFNILNISGNGSLIFGMKSYLNLINNLVEGENTRKWPTPTLTFIDRVGDVITCNVGYRYGLNDKNNFDSVGKFDWNITKPLPVIAFVKDEITIPSNTTHYTANKLTTRVDFASDIELDNMFGLVATPGNSIVVSNIPADSARLIKIPNPTPYAVGTKFTITKYGGSRLVVGCENNITIDTTTTNKVNIPDTSSVVITKSNSGVWVGVIVSNLTTYMNTKKMKLQINGFETDYVPVSTIELDNIMFSFAEVGGETAAYIEIDTLTGGCL